MYFRLRGQSEKKRKRSDHAREKTFSRSDVIFLRFMTFLIVWNSLSAARRANKKKKKEKKKNISLASVPSGSDFESVVAHVERLVREHREVTRSWVLQRQQFPSTFPLFNYTAARPPAFAARDALDEAPLRYPAGFLPSLPPPTVSSIFAVPLLRRLRVSRVVFTLRYVPRPL